MNIFNIISHITQFFCKSVFNAILVYCSREGSHQTMRFLPLPDDTELLNSSDNALKSVFFK